MSRRTPKHTRPIISAQLREAVLQVAGEHIPLEISGRDLDDEGVWEILMYASVNQMTIESACQELEQAPSGNTVREHLSQALDSRRQGMMTLEERLNAALAGQRPRRMRRRLPSRRFEMAMDLHDVPDHGPPELSDEEVRRGPAQSGTTHFHSQATLAIVHDPCRYELALTFVWADETLAQVVKRLMAYAKRLTLRIRRADLDKAFCGREVFAVLRAHRLPYIIPIPLRGKKDETGVYQGGIGQWFTGRRSDSTRYTFNADTPEAYTTDVAIGRTYSRGRYGRHDAAWFAYAVYGVEHIPPHQIFELYRRRFGIESGYRQAERRRARTASPRPALRLLLMGLALILLNIYMTLRQVWLTVRRYGSRVRRIWLTLRRLALLLSRLLEQTFGIIPIEQGLRAEAIS